MKISRQRKWIVLDVKDFSHNKEFDNIKEAREWMTTEENKNRNMDMITPEEFKWLLKQQDNGK